MTENNETYARIQSVRIKNLDQQVHLMRRELQRLREGMLQQNDVHKLTKLMERLKELNSILIDLRNYYNCMQLSMCKQKKIVLNKINPGTSNFYTVHPKGSGARKNDGSLEQNNKPEYSSKQNESLRAEYKNENFCNENNYKRYSRENAGLDQGESSAETSSKTHLIKENTDAVILREKGNDPFKTCKQLMDESKPPSTILGKHLMRLQDFRTDPELRRQRWERKQQEKLQQLRMKKQMTLPLKDQATLTEEHNTTNSVISLPEARALTNYDHEHFKQNTDFFSSSQYIKNGSSVTLNLSLIQDNLSKVIDEIINDNERSDIVMTIVLENDFYHVSISKISNSRALGCFLATEEAILDARQENLFQDLLTFFVVSAEYSKSQKNRILGHLFDFIKIDVN